MTAGRISVIVPSFFHGWLERPVPLLPLNHLRIHSDFERENKNLKCKTILINKAVWDKNIKIPLKVFNNTVSCRVVDNSNALSGPNMKMIDCITLDDLVAEIKPERLDMIKMDIEGAEIEALKGAVNTMEKYAPKFSIASYHVKDNKKTCFWIENFLREKGYSVQTFFPPHMTTYGEIPD